MNVDRTCRGGRGLREPAALLCVVVMLVSAGCSGPVGGVESPETGATASRAAAEASRAARLEAQNAGLQDVLRSTSAMVKVSPEPAGDVADGLYMAGMSRVLSSTPYPRLVFDIVTDENMPGTDSHVWNKRAHPQTASLGRGLSGREPTVIVWGDRDGLEVVTAAGLPRLFEDRVSGRPYYVELQRGVVIALWPVPFP